MNTKIDWETVICTLVLIGTVLAIFLTANHVW